MKNLHFVTKRHFYMKVKPKCTSPLLQQTLLMYLDPYLFEEELCDIIITDRKIKSKKVVFRIGFDDKADLKEPFTHQELLQTLRDFYNKDPRLQYIKPTKEELEAVIEKLNKKHQEKIAKLLKNYHEKC